MDWINKGETATIKFNLPLDTSIVSCLVLILSRREIYPKCDVEKTLGKFRTVSSTEPNPVSVQDVQESISEGSSPYFYDPCDVINVNTEVDLENLKTDSLTTSNRDSQSSMDDVDGQAMSGHKLVPQNIGYMDIHEQIK